MTLAGAIMAPRSSYIDATIAFNPTISFLTVIMALLGRRHLGVGSDARRHSAGADPGLIFDQRSRITSAIVLGLCFLGIVFFIPNGLLGLLQDWRRRWRAQTRR